jgi:hypothetical protein
MRSACWFFERVPEFDIALQHVGQGLHIHLRLLNIPQPSRLLLVCVVHDMSA